MLKPDKVVSKRKMVTAEEVPDVFKIRDKRSKILDKKRGTGITSFFGATCYNAKDRDTLINITKDLKIKFNPADTRNKICDVLKNKLMFLEKYSTGKDKMTYLMIPFNHPTLPFPLNLEDRVDYIQTAVKDIIKFKIDMNVKKIKATVKEQSVTTFRIEIANTNNIKPFEKQLGNLGFKLENNKWVMNIE